MKVCRTWYKSVANNPALWDVVRLLYCDDPLKSGFERWIRIPRRYTLDVTFSALPGMNKSSGTSSEAIWKQEVAPYLEKIEALCIQDCHTISAIIFPQLRDIAARATNLTTLSLQNIHDTPTFQSQIGSISVTFQALRSLELVNWAGIVPQLTCSQLRSLTMVDCDFVPGPQVWQLIRAAPRLSSIDMEGCTFCTQPIPYPRTKHGLRNLRYLSFSSVDSENSHASYVKVVKRLIECSPNLTHLQLSVTTLPQLDYVPPDKI
jgi:hypothetical protein